jgi:hypothetical protein
MLGLFAEVRPALGLPAYGGFLFAAAEASQPRRRGGNSLDQPTRGNESWQRRDVSPGGQLVTEAFDRMQQLAGNISPQHVCVNGLRHTYATHYLDELVSRRLPATEAQHEIELLAGDQSFLPS